MQFLPDTDKRTPVYFRNGCGSNRQQFSCSSFAAEMSCICGCGVLLLIGLACHHIRANRWRTCVQATEGQPHWFVLITLAHWKDYSNVRLGCGRRAHQEKGEVRQLRMQRPESFSLPIILPQMLHCKREIKSPHTVNPCYNQVLGTENWIISDAQLKAQMPCFRCTGVRIVKHFE